MAVDYTNTGCEQSASAPTGPDVINVTGPFFDNTCNGGCDLGQRLQIVYKTKQESGEGGTAYIEVDNPSPPPATLTVGPTACGEWMNGPDATQITSEDPKMVFYGTLWDFWAGFSPTCAAGAYPTPGATPTLCCNHRVANQTATQLQYIKVTRWVDGLGGQHLTWVKEAVDIVNKFGMGKM